MKLLSTLLFLSLLIGCRGDDYNSISKRLSTKIPYSLDVDDTNIDVEFKVDSLWNYTKNIGNVRGVLSFTSWENSNEIKRYIKEYKYKFNDSGQLLLIEHNSIPLSSILKSN